MLRSPQLNEPEATVLIQLGSAFLTQGLSELLQTQGYRCSVKAGEVVPDVIIVDGASIGNTTEPVPPKSRVLFLQMGEDGSRMASLFLWHRIHGILSKSAGVGEFKKAVRVVRNGRFWADHATLQELIKNGSGTTVSEPPLHFTSQERQIIECVCTGDTNKEISRKMHLSPHTVKTHLHNIFRKSGATNRTGLVSLASTSLKFPDVLASNDGSG